MLQVVFHPSATSSIVTSSERPWWLSWQRTRLQRGRPGFDPCVGKIPWRREQPPTPVFLPGEAHEQRSLAGYSPWGHTESDTTEAAEHACVHMFSHYPFFFFLVIRTLKIYPPNNLHIYNTGVLTSQHAVRYTPRTYLLHNWKFLLVTPFTYFFYACIP